MARGCTRLPRRGSQVPCSALQAFAKCVSPPLPSVALSRRGNGAQPERGWTVTSQMRGCAFGPLRKPGSQNSGTQKGPAASFEPQMRPAPDPGGNPRGFLAALRGVCRVPGKKSAGTRWPGFDDVTVDVVPGPVENGEGWRRGISWRTFVYTPARKHPGRAENLPCTSRKNLCKIPGEQRGRSYTEGLHPRWEMKIRLLGPRISACGKSL